MNWRKSTYLLLTAALGIVFVVGSCDRKPETDTRKVVILAGKPSHGEGNHGWDKDAQLLKQCLEGDANVGRLDIDVQYNGWPENPADLDDADAIVFLTDGHKMHPLNEPGRMAKIGELAGRGVGLAFLHYAVEPPEGAEADFIEWMGGCYERGTSQNPINTVAVTPVKNGHPITRGCGGYVAEDEWYFDIRFRSGDPPVVPLLTGKLPPWDPKEKVLAWATTRDDGGRGFGFSGGHFNKNWQMEPFRKLVLNAILWVAKADVPKNGVSFVKPWRFVSIPDFVNVDLTYPQPGWE
ncbi:MAG: ThuA domain-containing protein, partial [Sedimentisphaerales bacterium]